MLHVSPGRDVLQPPNGPSQPRVMAVLRNRELVPAGTAEAPALTAVITVGFGVL